MNRKHMIPALLAVLVLAASTPAAAAEEERAPTPAEKDFYSNVVLPTMATIKKAMPPTPAGWVVESETTMPSSLAEKVSGSPAHLHYSLMITYKREKDLAEQTKRRNESVPAVQKKYDEETHAKLDELSRKKEETEKGIARAQKRKEIGRERKLKKELDAINKRLAEVPEESALALAKELEPFVIRDSWAAVRVSLDERDVEFPNGNPFTRPKAAFALRTEGTRSGPAEWIDGKTIILYGDWQEVRKNVFHAEVAQKPFWPKPQTIIIQIIGDRARTDQMLKQMSLKDIVGLMK